MAAEKKDGTKLGNVLERMAADLRAGADYVRAKPEAFPSLLGFAIAKAMFEVYEKPEAPSSVTVDPAPDASTPRCNRCRMSLAAYVDAKGDGRGGYQHPYNASCDLSGSDVGEDSPDLAWTL